MLILFVQAAPGFDKEPPKAANKYNKWLAVF